MEVIHMASKFKTICLFGEDSDAPIEISKPDVKKLVRKTEEIIEEFDENEELDNTKAGKLLKSNKLSRAEKVAIVEERIIQVLGRQRKNIVVIKTKEQLMDYVLLAIKSGRIAIDTETNNSLDPVTCKLMGTCLYYPGGKQAYIPHNHISLKTGERLDWQLTEQDMADALEKIVNSGITIVMHNGKFDYEVLYCTTGVRVKPHWDTLVGWRLLDENDEAGLKSIYTRKVDPTQVKYDLGSLCESVLYEWLDPDIFALYAATDAMMTDKVYLLELPMFEAKGNERLYNLFKNVEMPIVTITGDMEMVGVAVDQKLGARLKEKYTTQLAEVDKSIETQLAALKPIIAKWRLTKEATEQSRRYEPKKSKKSKAEIEAAFPFMDEKLGKRYAVNKPKADQLPQEINLASPAQLAILFYDVLKCEATSNKSPRGTGSEQLKAIAKKLKDTMVDMSELSDSQAEELEDQLAEEEAVKKIVIVDPVKKAASELCDMILKRRGIMKLITTYIDVIPTLAQHWPDGRIRFHLNSLGTDTGRYSSGGKIKYVEDDQQIVVSGINIQNIPSHNKEIRMLFKAREDFEDIDLEANNFTIEEFSELETINGWLYPKDLNKGDILITDEGNKTINLIEYIPETKSYRIEVC